MRRTLVVVVALTLLAAGGSGCRSGRRVAGDGYRTTVTFVGWGAPEERAIFADALRELERREPRIRVVYTQVPGVGYDYLNKLRLMIAAGLAPDVFYVPDGAFSELVRSGALLDLAPLLETSALDLDAIWPTALDRYRFDGRRVHTGDLYALPKDLGPMVLYYDRDLLRRRAVAPPSATEPMTWDEAVDKWRALTFVDGGVQRWGMTQFPYDAAVWSSGGDILSPDGRTWAMATPVAIGAFQWCADLALRHRVAPDRSRLADAASASELFEAQLAAMHVDGRWMVPRYRRLAFDWDVAPVPVPRRGAPSIARSGSVGLAISARSPHVKEAFAVVEYLAGPSGQARLTAAGFQLPNQRALAHTEVFLQPGRRPAHAEVFVDAAETSRPGAVTRTPNGFWAEAFDAYAEEVWRGDRTASSLFPEIAPRIGQALRAAFAEAGLSVSAREAGRGGGGD